MTPLQVEATDCWVLEQVVPVPVLLPVPPQVKTFVFEPQLLMVWPR